MTPHVPLSSREIIKEVLEARQFGISMVHLHARDQDGQLSCKNEIYSEIINGIRQVDRDLILCIFNQRTIPDRV